ncbi:MAG: hypothetical protein V1778_04695 [bacterium]
MSLEGDIAREGLVSSVCVMLEEKILEYGEHLEAVRALKEVGREILADLPNVPVWAEKYIQLFRE